MLADAAWDDAGKMTEIGRHIEGQPVQGHPSPHAHADGGDFVFSTLRAGHPDADPPGSPLPADAENRQGPNDPILQMTDMGTNVAPAPVQIKQDIGDPLPGAMIGELSPPAGAIDGEAVGGQQIFIPGAGAGGIERRMFQQPDQFSGITGPDGGGAFFHHGNGMLVIDRFTVDPPFQGKSR